MIAAIIGSRGFSDYSMLTNVLSNYDIHCIVSGGAVGADKLAAKYAKENTIHLIEFLPDYPKYGKRAPLVRNELIINETDFVIAFWDGESRGTMHAVNYAKSINKPVEVINYLS